MIREQVGASDANQDGVVTQREAVSPSLRLRQFEVDDDEKYDHLVFSRRRRLPAELIFNAQIVIDAGDCQPMDVRRHKLLYHPP